MATLQMQAANSFMATPVKKMSDPKDRFYRHFQEAITAIQEQIRDLSKLAAIGGERQDCIDTILAGISRLSYETQDARDYIPPYDQRAYSQAIKALTEKLNEATAKLAPRSRFQFRRKTECLIPFPETSIPYTTEDPRNLFAKNPGGNDGNDQYEETRDQVRGLPRIPSSGSADGNGFKKVRNYNAELARPAPIAGLHDGNDIRKASFSSARTIAIYDHRGLHIILPASAKRATASGALTALERCIVDMTVPTIGDPDAAPFASLTIRNVKDSLVMCGAVAGPLYVAGCTNSVIVVSSRQVRVHECKDVVFYLDCGSHPVIEECEGIQFAPLPECYAAKDKDQFSNTPAENKWDQVNDFKWLKSEPSPHWRVLPESDRVTNEFWKNSACGTPSLSTDDILRKVGVKVPKMS